jgi:hypothetical protein
MTGTRPRVPIIRNPLYIVEAGQSDRLAGDAGQQNASAFIVTPIEFTVYLKAENERYGQLVRSRGMTAQ